MALTNTQYDELIRQYNAKQIRNQHIIDARKKEVYSKSEALSSIDSKISSISVLQAKKLLDGDETALKQLKQQILTLKNEKSALLHALGYPNDYFTPPYTCPDCKDSGYIDGKRCHCFQQAAIDLVYTQSNLKNILLEENFKHFSFEYFSSDVINPTTGLSSLETMQNARKECQKFIDSFDQTFSNLFFYGDTGVGKTFLSNCIAKELLDKGHSVIYFTAFQLFELLGKNVFHRDMDTNFTHQNIFDCDLLIIDDLGTEISNSFTTSQLFLCLNERILRKKSTIISTNLNISQLVDIYSERTFSRLSSNYTMIKLFGEDIRIQKKLR